MRNMIDVILRNMIDVILWISWAVSFFFIGSLVERDYHFIERLFGG